MALNNQERIEGLKIRALPRSAGSQIRGKHFGVSYVKVQKTDAKGALVFKEIDGKKYPEFIVMRDPETGDEMKDKEGKTIYVTKAVPDEMFVNNEEFCWAICNQRAESICNYYVKLDPETKTMMILEKKEKVKV